MQLIIASNLPPNYAIIKNFHDSQVKIMLNEIKNNKNTSLALKYRIDKILSGESWANLKDFINEND